ncbi:hypothetical protein KA344_06775 [bacterium]|nr:hypothetical protein [bacterium]
MSSDDHEREKLALDRLTIDHFTYLEIWGAPWQKAWLDLALLENRWDGNEIGRMVEERISYPDYAAKVTTPYPQPGWLEDLLKTIKPTSSDSRMLSIVIGHMADGVSQNMQILMKTIRREEAAQESQLAEAIYNEAIAAFSNYTPAELDQPGIELHRSMIDLSIRALRLSLSTHLMLQGREAEAEQSFPGIGKLADPAQNKAFMSELIGETLSSLQPNPEIAQAQWPADEHDRFYPGKETETDDNAKHLVWTGNSEFHQNHDGVEAKRKWQAALDILGNFIDTETGAVEQEQLARAAALFDKTPYSIPLIGLVSQTAWNLLELDAFDLARRYLLLDQALKSRQDSPSSQAHGYMKDLTAMLDHRYMGIALTGLGRLEEAEFHLLAAIEIAKKHATPQDVTGRKIEEIALSGTELLYWLLLTQANRTADADKLWQEFESRQSSGLAIEKWIAARTRAGDLQSPQIVQAKLLSRENKNST